MWTIGDGRVNTQVCDAVSEKCVFLEATPSKRVCVFIQKHA